MRLKACIKCGKLFPATKVEQCVCAECFAAERSTTIRPRTCRECGATFDGGPRAWYCSSCRAIRKKESAARCHKSGTIRPLGSIDHCTICGKEYIVNSSRQRYCKDCAPGAYRQADREASKKWNEENNYYELRAQKPRRGQKVCVICGKPISPGTPRITCSEECDRLRIKWHQERTQIRQGTRKAPTTVNRLDKDFMAQRKKKRGKNKESRVRIGHGFPLPLHIIRDLGVGTPPDLGEAVHTDVEQRRRL